MNIILGLFYFFLILVISFWLYLLVSFKKAGAEKRKAIEKIFAISISVLIVWLGPYIVFFLIVAAIIDILGKSLP
ncbi:MAG: hypothetical protein WCX23_03095 [Candidatus Paceibacterota bacterium]|jgi:hypothetical protein|nr:hypothetical protein [Candidatus Paceibacterota bacterium]MDD4875435.1 hypothetical protein [Candidatus Paceibacterota bacterium]